MREAALGPLLRRCGEQLGVPARSSLHVLVADDATLSDLNRRFLGADHPADVLAFPALERAHVGDVAISVDRVLDQGGDDPAAELRLLAVHGLLHCLGHDHAGAAAASRMTALTRSLLPDQVVPELLAGGG